MFVSKKNWPTILIVSLGLSACSGFSKANPKKKPETKSTQTKSTTKKRTPKTKKSTLSDAQLKLKRVRSLHAEFSQIQKNLALGTSKKSKGQIFIKRPDKFRWETLHPEKTFLISNGKKVWFYTAPVDETDTGQVMIRKAVDTQSRLAIDLLSGQADMKKSFKSKKLGPLKYHLTPKHPMGDIESLEAYLEKSTNLVYKLVLVTFTGNRTELVLKNIKLEPKLKNSLFQFKAPKNTEVIQ